MLWNRNDVLRIRFRYWLYKSSGSECNSASKSGTGLAPYLAVLKKLYEILLILEEEHCFLESCHFISVLIWLCIPFDVGSKSGSRSETGTGIAYSSGSAKAKSCMSGSGSTTMLTSAGYQWWMVSFAYLFYKNSCYHACKQFLTYNSGRYDPTSDGLSVIALDPDPGFQCWIMRIRNNWFRSEPNLMFLSGT